MSSYTVTLGLMELTNSKPHAEVHKHEHTDSYGTSHGLTYSNTC